MTDDAGDDTAEPPRERAPRRRERAAIVVLAVVVIAAIAAAGVLWSSRADLQAEADRRDEVAAVAARFAEALLTYDHEDLDASSDAVRELATTDFAEEYVGAFDAGLGGQIETLEATSSATIREVFVSQGTGDTMRAVVIADSEIVSTAGNRATVGTYLDITLVRLDGRWQVDDVTSVANAGSRLDAVPGSDAAAEEAVEDEAVEDVAPTSSTAPAPTSTSAP